MEIFLFFGSFTDLKALFGELTACVLKFLPILPSIFYYCDYCSSCWAVEGYSVLLCEYIFDEAVSCMIENSWFVVASSPSKSNKLVALGLKFLLTLRLPLFFILFCFCSIDRLTSIVFLFTLVYCASAFSDPLARDRALLSFMNLLLLRSLFSFM